MSIRVTCLICGRVVREVPSEVDGESSGLHAGACEDTYRAAYGWPPNPDSPEGQALHQEAIAALHEALAKFDNLLVAMPPEHIHDCGACGLALPICECEVPGAERLCAGCIAAFENERTATAVCA